MSFKSLPKVELHTHLEGCAPPAFIAGLAREKNLDISGIFDAQGNYVYRDFDHFLKIYEAACTTLQTPQDFHRLILAVLEAAASNGVVYMETFVSPDFCGGGDVSAWQDYLAAMQDAADQAESTMGIALRGIVTGIRHNGPENCNAAALCAAETMGRFITGYGMAGGEMVGRPGDFAYSFDLAREAGLRLTCHAGEWGQADMVAETISALKVERIGHGINAVSDARLVEEIVEKEIVLEVCPGSNVFLNAVPSWAQHPIQRLRDMGVRVTVSTDDPPFFNSDMTYEYQMLAKTFGWDEEDFLALNKIALNAAFCDDDTRAVVAKKLEPAA